jgi:hypothetical protein
MSLMPPSPFLPNSAEDLTSGAAECEATASTMPPHLDAVAEPIPVSPGVVCSSLPSGESEPSVMLAYAPGESHSASVVMLLADAATVIEPASPVMVAVPNPQDLIDEIFIGAQRLQPRVLPPDFHARLLEAIESDEIWADEPPLFLQRTRDV